MLRRLCLIPLSAVACLLLVSDAHAQQATLTGTVTDRQTGEPLAAVQVFIAEPGIGALTQQNGRYLLAGVPAGTHSVAAQRIGYTSVTLEVTVTADETTLLDFQLTEEALGLDEIIVTGTPGGTQRRAIGNAVATLEAAQVTQEVAVLNMQDLLTARTPGVQFARAGGNVGTGSAIEVRGTGSFNLGSNPLIYVDGVRVNNNSQAGPDLGNEREVNVLNDFNPQDIESIEIIKGPAAATPYGTEASAGVIQIITKRGAEGEAQFDASIRMGTNYLRDPASRIGTKWTCQGSFDPPCREGEGLVPYNAYEESNVLIDQGAFPWPQDELFQSGLSQSYNLGVRGGTQNYRYFLSGNYDNDEGITYYNWNKALRLRANIGVVFSENFSLDVSTGYVDGKTRFLSPADGDGGIWEDLAWGNGFCYPRINGRNACARLMGFQEHLPSDVAKLEATREFSRFTGSGTLNFTTGDWLSSRVVVGLDKGWDENNVLWPLEVQLSPVYEETASGLVVLERPVTTNFTADWSATARLPVTASWGSATSVGAQYYFERLSELGTTGRGFASPFSRTVNQTPPASADLNFEYIENKSIGFYVQEEFSYNDRLFLTGAVRFDDNSAFGAELEPETYPKVSATWVMSEESFWNFEMVNSFRLRGAWGQAGRQPDAFAGTNQYSVIPGAGGTTALDPSNPGNPAVGPERSTELEVGFDVALLDDRVSAEFTYFDQKNEDALLAVPLPPSLGFGGFTQRNLGRIDNWGWEASVNTRLYERPGVSINLGLTGSYVMNRIKDLGSFAGTREIRIGLPYPNYSEPRYYVMSAQFDPNGPVRNAYGENVSAMCDAGIIVGPDGTPATVPSGTGPTDQYGVILGGPVVPCGDAGYNIMAGPAFFPYRFSVNPSISLLDNTVSIHILADGGYGKVGLDGAQEWGHRYNNSYDSRCECDPVWIAGDRYRSQATWGYFDADFWKLREVGVRYNFTEGMANRIGADRASLSFSGRELLTIWQRQKEVGNFLGTQAGNPGLPVLDPEMGTSDFGSANHRLMAPLTSLHLEMRVTF